MTNPTGSPSRYQPAARPRNPPSSAPAMPRRMVTMKPPGSRPGVTSFATTPTARPNTIHPRMAIAPSSKPQETTNDFRHRAIDHVQAEFFRLLADGLPGRRIAETHRGNDDDVGAEPDADAEGHAEGRRHYRGDLRDGAVDGADDRAERVVDGRSSARFLVLGERVAGEAGGRASDRHSRVFGLRRRRFSFAIQIAQDAMGHTHCAGCQQASDQADDRSAHHTAATHPGTHDPRGHDLVR